jgi:hypothetical protein
MSFNLAFHSLTYLVDQLTVISTLTYFRIWIRGPAEEKVPQTAFWDGEDVN